MSKIINNINQLDLNGTYSYADYLLWQFKERVELIKGKIFEMSPAPNRKHQEVSGILYRYLDRYFEFQKCSVYFAPFDVRFVNQKKALPKKIFCPLYNPICVLFAIHQN